MEFANRYAPEHLILQVREPKRWAARVQAAGSVFLGPWSPAVAGDYASGTNHTLPTSGLARSFSGVSLDSFVKKITFQELSREGLRSLAPDVGGDGRAGRTGGTSAGGRGADRKRGSRTDTGGRLRCRYANW